MKTKLILLTILANISLSTLFTAQDATTAQSEVERLITKLGDVRNAFTEGKNKQQIEYRKRIDGLQAIMAELAKQAKTLKSGEKKSQDLLAKLTIEVNKLVTEVQKDAAEPTEANDNVLKKLKTLEQALEKTKTEIMSTESKLQAEAETIQMQENPLIAAKIEAEAEAKKQEDLQSEAASIEMQQNPLVQKQEPQIPAEPQVLPEQKTTGQEIVPVQ